MNIWIYFKRIKINKPLYWLKSKKKKKKVSNLLDYINQIISKTKHATYLTVQQNKIKQ